MSSSWRVNRDRGISVEELADHRHFPLLRVPPNLVHPARLPPVELHQPALRVAEHDPLAQARGANIGCSSSLDGGDEGVRAGRLGLATSVEHDGRSGR